jgi:class 3 adenylate cyclase
VLPTTPSPAPRVEGAERRQLTVMFCDLVGSTALSARLDPEDLRANIGTYHRCVAAVIERAGLQLVEAVAGLDTAVEAPLQVRVGIATGLVVVGDLIGQGAAQEQAVIGETPNRCRVSSGPNPGKILG